MGDIKRILLPTDFSQAAENAGKHAALIAVRNQAELHVLHVHELHHLYGLVVNPVVTEMPGLSEVAAALFQSSKERLERHQPATDIKVIKSIERDVAAGPAVIRYAEENGIDLIVMGTHSRQGIARLFMGSVAAEVTRAAPVSVMVVGPEHAAPEQAYQRILVPVDFSDASLLALRGAADIAEICDATLLVAHVIDDLKLPPYYRATFEEVERDWAVDELRNFIEEARLPVPAEPVVSLGKAHNSIKELAVEHAADLIVMGDAGLSGIGELLLGSVTHRLLRMAPCPVLVHRSAEAA